MTVDLKTFEYLAKFMVEPGKEINLKKINTDCTVDYVNKEQGEQLLKYGIQKMTELQDKLYAHDQYSVLIMFQGMDAAGKDGAIKHVMTGLNPQGVKVTSFKVPTTLELKHDYLWRHSIALPVRGEIGIFNRSHYENVLVTKVHPEFILKENLPGINKVEDIDQSFWDKRYKEINHFEKTLSDNGTVILKFFLHLSKKEQKKRFLERIDNPAKNWKFAADDLKERVCWKDYRKAYEEMLVNTSKEYAPWFVIPADDKWFTRLAIAGIIYREFEKLNLNYPNIGKEQKDALAKAREQLTNENEKDNNYEIED